MLLRAVSVAPGRASWSLMAAGAAAMTVAEGLAARDAGLPIAGLAGSVSLLAYPVWYVALVLRARRMVGDAPRSLWLDGLLLWLAASAFVCAILLPDLQARTSTSLTSLLALLAHPAADLALLGFLGGSIVMAGRLDRQATLLVAGIGAVPLLAIRLGKLPMPATTLPVDLSTGGQGLEPQPDRERVFAAVARTDEMLTGMLLGLTVTGVLSSLLLTRTGDLSAQLLVGVASGALLLRARLFVTIRQRLPLIAAGVAGYVLLAAALFVKHGDLWPLVGAFGVAVVAVLVALAGARYAQRAPSPYLGRAADVLDALCVVSVLPIACAVLGLYGLFRSLTS